MDIEESLGRGRADERTRAERRQQRQDAERRRMPQHGKGMGVMVGNAILRRAKGARADKRRRQRRV